MSAKDPTQGPMWTLTGRSVASRRERLRSAIAIVFAAVFAASAAGAQEDPWGDNARASEMARPSETQPSDPAASDSARASEPARESEHRPDDSADDDPEAQAEVEKSAAELEAVRKAEEKAGLLRSEEHTSELQSQSNLVCRLLLEKKKKKSSRGNTCH